MRQPVFQGACTALVTPFDENGAINYPVLDSLLEEQINAGMDAVCVCGTTGESATLSSEEQQALIAHTVQTVDHRIKVIAGAGSNDTAVAVRRSSAAQDAGADALLVVTPYYNKATQTGLVKHYEAIAHAVDLPIILYNVPSRTGVGFTAETYKRLSEDPRINGVKEAGGDLALAARTRGLCGEDFSLWSGNDDQVVPLMALGGLGVISVLGNILPGVVAEMAHLCLAGDFQTAARLQIRHMALIDALFSQVNPIPVKTALRLMGRDVGGLRLPLCDMDPKKLEALSGVLQEMGLLK